MTFAEVEARLIRYLSLTNGISALTKLFSAAKPHKIISNLLTRIFCTLILTGTLFSSPALAAGKGVVLNFNDVDISTMVKFISDLTGRNFVLDDRVKGKISVFSPSKLSNEEAYNVFVS